MSIRLSTGLRNAMLGTLGFKGALNTGVIDIYSGPQPANADAAPTGTFLGRVSVNGGAFTPGSPTNGLTLAAPAGAMVQKTGAETWLLTGAADGVAGWFRFKGNALDNDSVSTTLVRMDGTCGNSGADLLMANTTIVTGAPTTIDVFQFALPAA